MKSISTFLIKLLTLLVSLFSIVGNISAQIPSSCAKIESILVAACGQPEGQNEMLRFQIGASPMLVSNLSIQWATTTIPWSGVIMNATTAANVDSINAQITGCGYVKEPLSGILPAGAQVIIVTSYAMNPSYNSFANLQDTIYMLFHNSTNTTGHFKNYGCAGCIRTTVLTFAGAGGCTDTAIYEPDSLRTPAGIYGAGGGGSVLFNFNGTKTYYNDGCQIPLRPATINAGKDSTYRFCTSFPIISLQGSSTGTIKGVYWKGGLGTYSHRDSMSTTYTPSVLDVFPLQFILTARLACNDSIRDTVNAFIVLPVGTSQNKSICQGSSYHIGTHTYTTAGTYLDTLISTAGCDSFVTTHLTILVPTSQVLNLTGCGQVIYKGVTHTVNSTVLDTLRGSTGCDSIHYTVNIVIKHSTTHSQTVNLCQGQNITIAGHSHSTAGTYIDTLIAGNSAGCDSIVTTTVTVTTPTTQTVNLSGCNQIIYKGVTYTSSTVVLDTVRSVQGCDSVRKTVNITINNILRTTINPNICSGQSITVGSHTYNTAGTYLDTVLASGGCDSIITTHLTIIVPITQTVNLSGCGQVIYKGITHTSSTSVLDTLRGSAGCDSVRLTVNIAITNNSSLTQSVQICQGQSITVGPHSYSVPGTYIDTTLNLAGCDSFITTTLAYAGAPISAGNKATICKGDSTQLNATGGITYAWTPSTGLSDTSIGNPFAKPTVTTTYTVTSPVSVGNQIINGDFSAGNTGFSSAYTYTNVPPGAPCGTYGILGCEGYYDVDVNPANTHSQFLSFGDHTTGTGQMLIVNGATSPATNVWCQSVSVLPNTVYQFSAWAAAVDNSNQLPYLQFSINGAPLGSYFSPTLPGGVWSQFAVSWNSGLNTSVNICLVDSSTASGGNDFAIDDISFSTVCYSTDTVQVVVIQPSTGTQSPTICLGQSITVAGTSHNTTGTYTDTLRAGAASGCDSIITTNLTVISPTNGTLAVTGTCTVTFNGVTYSSSTTLLDTLKSHATGCDSVYVAVTITINPAVPATQNKSACINPGQSYFVGGQNQTTAGVYADTLHSSGGCDSIITLTTLNVITPVSVSRRIDSCNQATINGTVYHSSTILGDTVLSALGCDSITRTDSIMIHTPVAIAIASSQTLPLVEGDSTVLTIIPAGTYQNAVWTPDSNISSINAVAPTVSPQHQTTYSVVAADSNNCLVSGSILITVKPNGLPDFVMPTAFSPNGDGKNDIYKPILRTGAELLMFHIYNRWGELVYDKDKDNPDGWDGTYKNVNQPIEVYVFYITVKGVAGNVIKHEGNLTLLR